MPLVIQIHMSLIHQNVCNIDLFLLSTSLKISVLHYRYSGTAEKTDMRVKRRWDDDVVFKNCSRAAPEKKEANFINDSLRSEFHRKFMNKYIK